MEFKEVIKWKSDNMPLTTEVVVVVSECGSVVKRLPYRHWNQINGSYSNEKEYIYKQSGNRGKGKNNPETNYQCVFINGKTHQVHRLVAMAWLPNPFNKPQVNHKDGNKRNNHIDNLEWVTNLENMRHSIKNGFHKPTNYKLDPKQMPLVIKMRESGMTLKEIANHFNVSYETIRFRIKGNE